MLAVPLHEADKVLAGLAAYEKETRAKAQRREAVPRAADLLAATLVGLLLLGFFAVTVVWELEVSSRLELGSANAGRIVDGELWRSVTALSLHGDSAHAILISNAFALAVFFGAASGQLRRRGCRRAGIVGRAGGISLTLLFRVHLMIRWARLRRSLAPWSVFSAASPWFGAAGKAVTNGALGSPSPRLWRC